MFIFQENLDAQVDGVNQVFTMANNISMITDVIFDGVPFIGTTSVTGLNQITLSVAPTVSLRVSYYTTFSTGSVSLLTVQDAIDRLKRQFNDSLGELSNDMYFDWFTDFNYLMYRILYKNDPTKYVSEVSYNITSGTNYYSLPVDFKDIKVRGTGVFVGTDKTKLIESGYGSTKKGFYFAGNSLILTPTPTEDDVMTLRYIARLAPITALTDILIVDREHFKLIIDYLDREYGQWNIDTVKEMSADTRFARDLSILLNDTYRSPKVLRF